MKVEEAGAVAEAIRAAVSTAVVGRELALDEILTGLTADGHLLIEDMPGLGKTLMAKSFAAALGLDFQRIQFTADLLPHDITGSDMLDTGKGGFVFRRGPIFANILLADEINRAPPKVQSALLEAMQEYQVTSERSTYPLPRPFLVLATENPLELEGTYPLPEAQVDRFLMRLKVGYPTTEEERTILERRRARKTENVVVPRRRPRRGSSNCSGRWRRSSSSRQSPGTSSRSSAPLGGTIASRSAPPRAARSLCRS